MPGPDAPGLPPTICGSDGATDDDGPRHSAGWYRRTLGDRAARPGQPVMIRCVDGPVRVWLETFPPRLEIEGHGGVYVLVDDGPVHSWTYRFVTSNG